MLLTPGPVDIPAFVQAALLRPVIHHRTAVFRAFYTALLARLRYLFQTEAGAVCTATGSGTYGVEMAMYSLFAPGARVLALSNGKFSARWAAYGPLLGLEVVVLERPWGASFEVGAVLAAAAQYPDLQGVVITHSETSTGTLVDLEPLALALKAAHPGLLLLVDAITSVGALPFYFDAWQIDCAVVASQKALLNPAGLVAFAFSAQAQAALRETHSGDFRNLGNYLQAAATGSYPYTAPVSLLYGLDAALAYIGDQSLPVVWNRCHDAARMFREGLDALGGKLLSEAPSDSLTAFLLPGRDTEALRRQLAAQHDLHLAGGQDAYKGRLLRVSHMGMADAAVMREVLGGLGV
ncbi:MAG: alanine--glyoxylate aminotransferase family protein [Bacteroidia bacterium]